MPGAAQVIMAKLVAHDPENVFRARHVLHFGDFGRFDAAISNRQLQTHRGADQPCCVAGVAIGVQGSAAAAPFAFADTGASPITSTSACSDSLTPWPVAPETRSGVFFAARLRRSFFFFRSSGVTASILLSATISILSVRFPS